MHVAVLGLGEAGARIAADLAEAGCAVRGWDPVRRPAEIVNADSALSAVEGADVVLSCNAAAVALDVAAGVADALAGETLYADLNTASSELKAHLAGLAGPAGVGFADVALMSPVPGNGLRTPMLAAGPAAGPGTATAPAPPR